MADSSVACPVTGFLGRMRVEVEEEEEERGAPEGVTKVVGGVLVVAAVAVAAELAVVELDVLALLLLLLLLLLNVAALTTGEDICKRENSFKISWVWRWERKNEKVCNLW
jgi:hypothetical protein